MHLIIVYCSYIWSNEDYYALAWIEQIIFACMEQQLHSLCLYLFLCFWINWSEMTEHLRRDDANPSEEANHQRLYWINHILP